MSWFTSLRDNVIKPAVGTALAPITGGLSLGVVAADAAKQPGGGNTAGSAAPSGAVGAGGVPNKNPNIFSSIGNLSNQTLLLIAGGLLIVLLVMRVRR